MKLLLLVLGNAVVLGLLVRWLLAQRQHARLRHYLWPSLALRLVAGVASIIHPTADAKYYLLWSRRLTVQLFADPAAWGHTLLSDAFHHHTWKLIFHGYSNTLFFIKLLSALNLLTGGSGMATALYLAVAGFVGCWVLVRELNRAFPGTRGAAIIGLLLWPSVIYWTSGITKESLLMASSAGLVAVAVRLLYGPRPERRWRWVLGGVLCAWLNFKMRFFFGGTLLAVLAALAVVRAVQQLGFARRRRVQVALVAAVLGLGLVVASEISPVFRFNKFASQLTRTYATLRDRSQGRPYIDLPGLAPTETSILRHTPKAVGSVLLRPLIWEGDTTFYGLAALENLGILVLMVAAGSDLLRRRTGPLPFAFVVALLLYCLILAALLGLSTPNLGTLNRYRAPWLSVFIYLLASQPTVSGWLRRLQVLKLP